MKKSVITKILIAVFCLFIGIIGILYAVLPVKEYSSAEKRYLSTFPKVTFSAIKDGTYSEKFEEFLADQTPFRTFFVSLNSYYNLLTGNNGSNGVYLGKNGFLIEKPFSRDNSLDKNLNRIKYFCDDIDVNISLIAVPSKGYIYSSHLPKNSMNYLDDEYNRIIREKLSDKLNIIDISDCLKEEAENNDVFYKTDHHWTSYGAYAVYKQYCNSLGLNAADVNNYDIQSVFNFYGTSYSTSCYTLTKPDTLYIFRNKAIKDISVTITEGKNVTTYNDFFFENRLNEDDKYPVFLDGNHSRVDITTNVNNKKLLIIKDSFAHCLAPFLAEQYGEIVMVDLRYYKKSLSDIVINEGISDILFVYSIENLATSKDIIFD